MKRKGKEMDFIDKIMAYEDGSLTDDQELELYSELISTGQAWTLQGSYGDRKSVV